MNHNTELLPHPRFRRAGFVAMTLGLSLLMANSLLARQEIPAGPEDDTRTPSAGMMRYPDVSASHIVFSYAGDLWVVSRDGGMARPLASSASTEQFPRFSADGSQIAFTGNYEGDTDLYVVSVDGGIPTRMTWHPASETLCDWTPDGGLLYSTNGFAGLGRVSQLFTTSTDEPYPHDLPVPYGTNGALSADGTWLAYTPHSRDTRTWKRYRGGMASDIWLFNLETNESKQITDWEGTDSLPMWHEKTVYYLSDNGENARLNIWAYDVESGEKTQITNFKDFDCKWPSIGPGPDGNGEIVVQNGASLWLVDLGSGESRAVAITVPGDKQGVRERLVDVSEFIESVDVSPSGKRIVVEARGDIWTAPVENGSPRNLTRTNGTAERMPSWSPDGQWIAYLSDASGEYELYVTQSDGRGETRQLTEDGKSWRYNPTWSPDSKSIVFTDKAGNIFLHVIESGETTLVDTDPYSDQRQVSWSHDSKWLTYALADDNRYANDAVWVYNVESGEKNRLTSFFPSSNPVFDRKGDYIFCSSNRAFDRPSYEDVGTTFIYDDTEVLIAIPLRADVKQPLLPESDEEEWKDGDDDDAEDKEEGESDDESDDDESDDDESDDEDESDDDDSDEQGPSSLSGTWSGRLLSDEMPEEARNFTMMLNFADDGTVTGSVSTPEGSLDITSGSYDAETGEVSLVVSGGEVHASVKGVIKDGKFTGTAFIEAAGMEIPMEATRDGGGDGDEGEEADDKEKKKDDKKAKPVTIDFEGIEARSWQIPVSQGGFGQLAVNDKGHLIYSRRGSRGDRGSGGIKIFDLEDEDKAEKSVVDGGGRFTITPDGKKLMVARGDSIYVVSAAAGQKLSDKVSTDGMKQRIDPRVEWKQIFTDAWRIERDFFYDPNMHGVDWEAIRDHYGAMVDECTSRADLGFVIGEMIAEINVGHAYYRGSREEGGGPSENVGLLGCDFDVENERYRIGTIYEGAPWDTDARNPLRAVGIKEGQYLLAVDGIELNSSENPYARFVGKANMVVVLTISDDATLDEDDKRIPFKLMPNDNDLRFRGWIESRRRMVDEMTDGKVGYIYVVNTGVPGQNDLFRQFAGQAGKEALIIDDRWNGGGQIPTRFIELLNRPVTNYWAKRDGRDWTWPPDSHQGPKCMLINGMAGSGGDMFPALFRQNGLGKLVGMRTWGGLVGISGNPSMIDGSGVTAPTFAYYEKDGTWGIEGHGVDPDIEVIDDPAEMVDGGDPQLEAAIELMLEEIRESGYSAPDRPEYPDRSKIGIPDEDK